MAHVLILVLGISAPHSSSFGADQRKELAALKAHQQAIYFLEFSPDGKLLASAGGDGTVKLWNVRTRKQQATLKADFLAVECLSFSPDGKTLASGGWDKTIKLWDVATGKQTKTLRAHRGVISSLRFSADGKLLLSTGATDKTAKLWDVSTTNVLTTFRHCAPTTSAAFIPGDKTVVSSTDGGRVQFWEGATGKRVSHYEVTGYHALLSPNGKMIAVHGFRQPRIAMVTLLDALTGKQVAALAGHTQHITAISFSLDSKFLATGSADNTVKVWNVFTQKPVATLKRHTLNVIAVAFSPDRKTLASGSLDETIRLWDLLTAARPKQHLS
jgi:WD40 repeat protein